ncbi:MAG TPA: hypothetical protein VKB12_05585 [Pyrinomonadaceae bacterium]|nr:hypothetical protein [Pyrinomonadaceae bacterium]
MAERDLSRDKILFSDVPGDREKVRVILSQWGVEEHSIRRLMRGHHDAAARDLKAQTTGRQPEAQKHTGD